MRKRITAMLVSIAMVLCMIPTVSLAAAGDTSHDDVLNYMELADGTLMVIGLYNPISVTVDIPSDYAGKAVTAIKNDAFRSNGTIKTVTIPSSVTSIEDRAFADCDSLSSVMLSDGLEVIGNDTFASCEALESVEIPSSVVSIGASAFYGCNHLSSVTLNEGLETIDLYAFNSCGALTDITIPASVSSFGMWTFANCTQLKNVTLTPGLKAIGYGMFSTCNALKSITIPSSVTSIGENAFASCGSLDAITIPSSVTSIGNAAFSHCIGLESVTLSEGLTAISNAMFYNCESLESIIFPKSLKSVGDQAFIYCYELETVTIPGNFVSFGSNIFSHTKLDEGANGIYGFFGSTAESYATSNSLNFIELGDDWEDGLFIYEPRPDDTLSVTGYFGCGGAIAIPAFYDLDSGNKAVTTIMENAFYANPTITSVTIPAGITSVGDAAFLNCDNLSSVALDEGLENIGEMTFYSCDALASITIPASVISIGASAFNECENLNGVTLSDGLKKIGTNMFGACNALTSITIPSSVTTIGEGAFSYCAGLSSVTLSNGLKTIGDSMFHECGALTSITVPSSVTAIGQNAFLGCKSLKKATILSKTATIGTNAFAGTDIKSDGIYGYAGSPVQTYATANGIPFHAFQATVSALPNNAAYGTVSGSGAYNIDGSATVSAAPKAGYHFVRWTESGTQVSSSADYTFTVTADRTLVAVFEQDAPVTPPAPAVIPVGVTCTKTDATLYGTANGSITASASGGNSGSYEYSLYSGAWQSGNVFGSVAAGTYTVTVRDAGNIGNTAACSVSIGQPPSIGSISAKKIPAKENAGTALTIVPPAAPKGYITTSVTYSSSNPAIATVDVNGNVTFLTGGKVTIITKIVSAAVDKKGKVRTKTTTVKKTITVIQPVASVSLNVTSQTIAPKQKLKLTAAVAPATASNKKLTWKSSNPKVAAVSSSGVVTGKAGGTAVITCTTKDGSGVSASCIVTVTPVYPTALKISKAAVTMKAGKTVSLKATIAPKATDFKTVVWTSSNPAIAVVDAKGRVKALSSGTAVITAATSNGISVICTVTVQ